MNADDICYLEDGRKVYYVGKAGNQHAVRLIYEHTSREMGTYEEASEKVSVVPKVYVEPPTAAVNEAILKLKTTVHELCVKRNQIAMEITALENTKRVMEDAAKSLPDITTTLDFLAGRITHVVTLTYYGYKIQTLNEVLSQKDDYKRFEGMKLLCLYGTDKNKKTKWCVSDYYDGSGSWNQIHPFKSEEEAKEFVKNRFAEQLKLWRDGEKHSLDKFQKLDFIEWPSDWLESVAAVMKNRKEAAIAELKKKIAELESADNAN